MAWFVTGDPPVLSTAGTATNPSTTTIIAELDSTQLLTINRGGIYQFNLWVGSDTAAVWWAEHCVSTGLGSSAITKRTILRTASGQHSQFVLRHKLEQNDRFRVRVGSTSQMAADVTIGAERLE